MRNNKESKKNFIIGLHPVLEAIEAGKSIQKILFSGDNKRFVEIFEICKKKKIPLFRVSKEAINRYSNANHQGIIALTSPIDFYSIEDLVDLIFEKGELPLLVYLDGVTDVRNFGGIARTCECAGVHAILTPPSRSARINEVAIKTSAGALSSIPVCKVFRIEDTIKFLKESGVKIIACNEKSNKIYTEINYNSPLCFIFGSEDEGISQSILKLTDETISIPMKGNIKSLNVGVSAGIILFEAIQRRK